MKVYKALILQPETLAETQNIRRRKYMQEFYNRLARVIRTFDTMGKTATAQADVCAIFNELGPVKKALS